MIAIGRQMTVNFRSAIPVFRQIAGILLAQIDTGELPAGEPIPPQAELAARLEVARGTCAKAVRTLRDAGIVYVVTGKGSVSLREGKAAQAAEALADMRHR